MFDHLRKIYWYKAVQNITRNTFSHKPVYKYIGLKENSIHICRYRYIYQTAQKTDVPWETMQSLLAQVSLKYLRFKSLVRVGYLKSSIFWCIKSSQSQFEVTLDGDSYTSYIPKTKPLLVPFNYCWTNDKSSNTK